VDGTLSPLRHYFEQQEAVETVLWLHDVRQVKNKFDLLRFDASGAVVDFDYMSRKEIIKVQRGMGIEQSLPGVVSAQGELAEFEDRWTGGYIFENTWQSFRPRQDRKLELTTAEHVYQRPGRYTVAVKVIDIFGNDTMTLVPVNVG
jgi:hypothetical protein